jgi:hypothetical protein
LRVPAKGKEGSVNKRSVNTGRVAKVKGNGKRAGPPVAVAAVAASMMVVLK